MFALIVGDLFSTLQRETVLRMVLTSTSKQMNAYNRLFLGWNPIKGSEESLRRMCQKHAFSILFKARSPTEVRMAGLVLEVPELPNVEHLSKRKWKSVRWNHMRVCIVCKRVEISGWLQNFEVDVNTPVRFSQQFVWGFTNVFLSEASMEMGVKQFGSQVGPTIMQLSRNKQIWFCADQLYLETGQCAFRLQLAYPKFRQVVRTCCFFLAFPMQQVQSGAWHRARFFGLNFVAELISHRLHTDAFCRPKRSRAMDEFCGRSLMHFEVCWSTSDQGKWLQMPKAIGLPCAVARLAETNENDVAQ